MNQRKLFAASLATGCQLFTTASVSAHPGHGVETPDRFLHYLLSPSHIPAVAFITGLVVLVGFVMVVRRAWSATVAR